MVVAQASISIPLGDVAATARLAARIAALARPGDLIALSGPLGAGKTSFARAFIFARFAARGLPAPDVPSPTFTLVQTYELPSGEIWHFDLYRLEAPEEAEELAMDEAFAGGISLIEWPERLGSLLPPRRLEIVLDPVPASGPTARRARITAHDRMATGPGLGAGVGVGWAARLRAGLDV